MACSDLCSAAKCAELESRLERLEFELNTLEEFFNVHITQPIPLAHDFQPEVEVKVLTIVPGGELLIEVIVNGVKGFSRISLSDLIYQIGLQITAQDKLNYLLQVSVNDVIAENTLTLPEAEPEPNILDVLVDFDTQN